MVIEEIIVVEGRDDTAAVKKSVDAITIETHGYGITEETWRLIEKAAGTKGIIIFTDPDSAGERIRKRINWKKSRIRRISMRSGRNRKQSIRRLLQILFPGGGRNRKSKDSMQLQRQGKPGQEVRLPGAKELRERARQRKSQEIS